jgi:hypothetical protein
MDGSKDRGSSRSSETRDPILFMCQIPPIECREALRRGREIGLGNSICHQEEWDHWLER